MFTSFPLGNRLTNYLNLSRHSLTVAKHAVACGQLFAPRSQRAYLTGCVLNGFYLP
jgi:hypothetical protein